MYEDIAMQTVITLPKAHLEAFCRKWKITELSLFGSVLREDFSPESDVDVLVAFDESADWGLFEHSRMEEELSQLLGKKVDLVSRRGLENSRNWIRKREILGNRERIYADR
ncbi:MAG: nucleotidyltransferase domain-containing protein [Thermoguttaceae bacterium]|jgi:predicted nucleotidyltransferase